MINEENLIPLNKRSKEVQRAIQEKGRQANKAKWEARKTLKEELILLLSQGDTQEKISLALIQKALNGDTKAFEVIRDSIGEKQTDKIEQSGEINNTITVKLAGDIQEWGK
jgi:DNA segregation ATPase FtsK/SpoIIIE-like protein